MSKSLIISTAMLFSVASSYAATNKVIYGSDNRHDLYEVAGTAYHSWAESTAVMVEVGAIKYNSQSGNYDLAAKTLESGGICPTERFANQYNAGMCSGFLVAPNLLVTAGHCMTSMRDCTNNYWVFDYAVNAPGEAGPKETMSHNVYGCAGIIAQTLDKNTLNDFALIALDRPVEFRRPLPVRESGTISSSDTVVVIGHPSGLPTKVTTGGVVRTNSNPFYFTTNLDTYGGNSGSVVINERTGIIEGILVRGERDYVYSPAQQCQVSNLCSETGCRGEDVTRITNIPRLHEYISIYGY